MSEGAQVFFTEKFYKSIDHISQALYRIALALETAPLPEILEELKATNKNLLEIARRD